MNRNLVIFEDDVDCLDILNLIFLDKGCQVHTYSSWDSNTINTIINLQPHIILLDEWLMEIRGSEICRILKSVNQLKGSRIYLLSAVSNLEAIAKGCSADGYIEKPFDLDEIEALLFV